MPRNVWNDIVSWRTGRLNNSTKYLLHASMTITSKRKNWNLKESCQKYALKLFWNACIWHVLEDFDTVWSVNKLARSITKWTRACDKRLSRLISYIHHTCEYKQHWYVGDTAKQCRLGLFQDSDFCGRSWGFKIHFWRNIVRFGKSYICSNKLNVQETNFSFTQFNRIRNHLFGCRIEVWRYSRSWFPGSDCFSLWKHNSEPYRTERPVVCPHTIQKRKQSLGVINDLDNVHLIPSNVQSSHQQALLYVFEDNEAVIKMIIKGRSPTMRHVSRTHRVALGGCSIEWIWTPKSKSNTLTPKTNLLTC